MQRHQVRSTHNYRSQEAQGNNEELYDTDDEGGDMDAGVSINGGLLGDEALGRSSNVFGDDDYDEDFEDDQDDDLVAMARTIEHDDDDATTERLSSKALDDLVDDMGAHRQDDSFDAPEKEDLSEEEDGLEAKSEGDITKEITIIEGIIEESRARCRESLGESLFQ